MRKDQVDDYEFKKLVAQVKFSFIAPIISKIYEDENMSAYFNRVSKYEVEWPDGTKRKFSAKTLKYWLHLYRKLGYEGLLPRGRLDAGSTRKLTKENKERVHSLIQEFPKITGVMVYEKMIEEGLIQMNCISVDTVQRYIRKSGIRNENQTIEKERRSWEYEHACDGYQADTCHTFYIYDEDGNYRKTYLIAMIDVHSRLIVGAQFFYHDNAKHFQKVWKSAVLRYGKSKVIILDNGSSYKNKSTKEIEMKLGTKLIYNPPYCPIGKAIIERWFKTCKDRFLHVQHGADYHSLKSLNEALNHWIHEYNRSTHSSLSKDKNDNHTPLERYLFSMKDTQPWQLSNKNEIEYESWLDEVFLHETTRKVNGDSTVLVENILFDVPSIYIGVRVLIRYEPIYMETIYLYDVEKKEKVKLVRTDKVENSKTRREGLIY